MNVKVNLPSAEYACLATVDDLTPREMSVLTLITAGYSNHDICTQLHVSINSVKTYVRSTYRKIGIESRGQAILWGVRHGLIDLDELMETGADVEQAAA
ncbi:MAG: LuxR C-terminal-related transcriptional regulator [Nocardioides sp.]